MLWKVPVTVSVISGSNQKQTTFLLEGRSQTITLDDVSATDAIKVGGTFRRQASFNRTPHPFFSLFKVNPGQYGFYRVNYTPEMFDPLRISLHTSCTPGLSDSSLPPQDRMGLQNDALALVSSVRGFWLVFAAYLVLYGKPPLECALKCRCMWNHFGLVCN